MRRSLSVAALAAAVVAVLACATGEERPKMAPGTPPDPVPAAGSAKEQEPAGPCTDDCLLLLEYDARDLRKGAFCEICPSEGCTGWPREELGCEEVDYLRNCMYARLGYTFDKAEEWREVFDKEAWYEPRESFRWSDVSKLQVRNATWLKSKADRRDCVR